MTAPGPVSVALQRAAVLEREGRRDVALQLLRTAAGSHADAGAHRSLAQAAMRLGDTAMAIEKICTTSLNNSISL